MMNKGFTLVELLVSVGIFILMTTLLVAKYGNFDQSVLLTNLAYDVAITVRTAQTYGLSVRASTSDSPLFNAGYGVHFVSGSQSNEEARKLIFFVDSDPESLYSGTHEDIDTYYIKRGAYISEACAGNDADSCVDVDNVLDITFKRPDPNAQICIGSGGLCGQKYARITITGTEGSTRTVVVQENGQISVKE
jgi:hypothetical protein